MEVLLNLFFGFLKVGCFAFGGAYGAIPLIRDVVLSNMWLTDEYLSYMIAVSESTPGPIMINLACYIGSQKAGLLGAIVSTVAVILPSFIIILLVMAIFKNLLKKPVTQAILRGLKPCIIGIILATGIFMIIKNCIGSINVIQIDLKAIAITFILFMFHFIYLKHKKKKESPILVILIAAILGILLYPL